MIIFTCCGKFKIMNLKKVLLPWLILLTSCSISAQNKDSYQSKIADLGDIRLQYMDFGGNGPTLILIQDFHNYFEGIYQDTTYFHFYNELAKDFSVLAPVRRGYGKSTDTNWGYDVATQSSDLLRFMDVLGIEKAVLFGRIPASQDMTWIAEHHPERVLGLIYDGNPILISSSYDVGVIEFVENWSIIATDFEKEKQRTIMFSRLSWEPHFLHDKDFKINIPALRLIDEKYNWSNPSLAVLESGFLKLWVQDDIPGREDEVNYLRTLLQDSVRLEQLHQVLIKTDKSKAIDEGMQRAFGNNLQTIEANELDIAKVGLSAYLDWKLKHIRLFVKSLTN
jgi:pimeloyl-ACP methyl ester carboxylesterase